MTRPDTAANRDAYVVLVPALEIEEARSILPLAIGLARHMHGRVSVVRIVQVPPEAPLSDGVVAARHYRAEFDQVPEFNTSDPVPVRTVVRVAHQAAEGIAAAVAEEGAHVLLLGWDEEQSSPERLFGPPIDQLLRNPPCDTLVVKLRTTRTWRHVLLPVRAGPHTPLACQTTVALAELYDATITVLYATDPRQPDHLAVREELQSLTRMPRVQRWLERALPPEQAILAEAPDHDAIVLGVTGRRGDPEAPAGPLADRILRLSERTVILVCHKMAQAEEQAQLVWQQQRDLSLRVDRWFAQNTFSSTEYEDLTRLVALKQQQGLTISLVLPTLNEEQTIGRIITSVRHELQERMPLLDEILVIDSHSEDRTTAIARELGVPVHIHQEILPQYGAFRGKGEALWKSLYVTTGDIIAWIDTDIQNIHPRFVYGIIGPLLREPRLVYCKGFYRRPILQGQELQGTGGGRVTELTARPLLNLFYPELSGVVQPLAGEYAGRREALEWLPFFTGYGVEIGLLIDLLEQFGLDVLAQVDLQQRVHRNQELIPLSQMAFAITQVVIQRLEARHRLKLLEAVNQSMKLIQYAEHEGFHLEVREIRDHERPPMASIPEYRKLRGMPPLRRH